MPIWKQFRISVEGMRPAYNQAIQVLATTGVEAPSAKTTLVFHGIPAEALELQVTCKETAKISVAKSTWTTLYMFKST